jgi:TolB-like protein/lipoprotein NlpI
MGCTSEDDLLAYLELRLASGEVAAVEAHLRGCDGCRRTLAELSGPEPPAPEGEPAIRYEVLGPIGAGGMGVVYRARDRTLRRTVALKMLRPFGEEPARRAKTRERLLREARAMARLSHPNVLAVYDVGELGGQVFVAMELVEGRTLAAWLRESPRTWREVLDAFLQAAQGLTAAHAAGLIHRDFKPDNVLVGSDGRVRVTDFGLAFAVAPVPGESTGVNGPAPAGGGTVTALAGSPPYMAPEQLRGEAVDARADVFSYCVALHEALHGERPFQGSSFAELMSEIQRGELHAPRGRRRVPAWLRRTVSRGLRHDPAERFQTMEAISSALKQGRASARRRVGLAAALLAFVVLGAAVAGSTWRERTARPGSGVAIRSLAVLPLADVPGSASGDALGDALTEAITADLGRTPGLRVSSRRSAAALAESGKPPVDVGRELNVDAIVEGNVRRSGNEVRVELRVRRSGGGEQVWATRLEGDARDEFALEDRASRAIRDALALSPVGTERVRRRPTRSSEAFDSYLAGRTYLLRENERDQAEAIRLLEHAVALDPDFAEALAQLSLAQGNRFSKFTPDDTSALERAESAARRALELDPDLAEAHYAAAHLIWGVLPDRFLHERAVQEVKRALALNPNLASAHHYLAVIYLHIGLFDEATRELQKTLLLDPMDANALRRIAVVLVERGKYQEALRAFEQVPRQADPSLWSYDVAWTLQFLGRTGEARALVDQYLGTNPGDRGGVVTSVRAILRAKAGDERGAKADVAAALQRGKGFVHFHHTTYNIASTYALLGDAAEAVRWLRVTAETGWPCYPLFDSDPNLLRIRDDPGYVAFMGELRARWERYRSTLAP